MRKHPVTGLKMGLVLCTPARTVATCPATILHRVSLSSSLAAGSKRCHGRTYLQYDYYFPCPVIGIQLITWIRSQLAGVFYTVNTFRAAIAKQVGSFSSSLKSRLADHPQRKSTQGEWDAAQKSIFTSSTWLQEIQRLSAMNPCNLQE